MSSGTIQIFAEDDASYSGFIFDLAISSSVLGETTWQNTQLVTIVYESEPLPVPETDIDTSIPLVEAPQFEEETSIETLQIAGNKMTPIVLDCTLYPWEKVLPSILNETQDNKVTVSVDLGTTSTFLTYSTYERKFELLPSKVAEKRTISTAVIKLANQNSQTRQFELKVAYSCLMEEEVTQIQNTISEPRFDKDPPVPVIDSISSQGEVTILFDRKMESEAVLSEDDDTIYEPAGRILTTEKPSRV